MSDGGMEFDNNNGTVRRYGGKRSAKVLAFIEAVDDLCFEYGMTISHEDEHGSFQILVGPGVVGDRDWFKGAAEISKGSVKP